LLFGVDRSEGEDHDVSSLGTGVLVLLLWEVGHLLVEVVVDGWEVGPNVLSDKGWVTGDGLTPLGESVEVTLEVSALVVVLWEVHQHKSELLDTRDDSWEGLGLEVLDGSVESCSDMLGISEAGSELIDVVDLESFEDESVKEFNDLLDWEVGKGWLLSEDNLGSSITDVLSKTVVLFLLEVNNGSSDILVDGNSVPE